MNIDNAICNLLDEQERQEAQGDDDDENDVPFVLNDKEIAEEYLVHSQLSLVQAQNRARRLAQHMRDIELLPAKVTPRLRSPGQSRTPGVRPPTTLAKNNISVRRRAHYYGRQVNHGEDVPQVVNCTTPVA